MNIENIIDKIEKLFALAEKNPEEQEAIAAAAKAQELIAKYNIEVEKLGKSKEEEITTVYFNEGVGYKWRYALAAIIATNFRCKTYVIGRESVVFYGFKRDVESARQVFKFLFKMGNKLADKEYNLAYADPFKRTRGVRNTFLVGFLHGVKSVLDEQCKALMIIIPTEVEEAWKEKSKDMGTLNNSLNYNGDWDSAYEKGYRSGRESMQSRSIASGADQLPA